MSIVYCSAPNKQYFNNICDTIPLDNSSNISVPALPYILVNIEKLRNSTSKDPDGNLVQKPEAILYYNRKMAGVNSMDQPYGISVWRKTYEGYYKYSSGSL